MPQTLPFLVIFSTAIPLFILSPACTNPDESPRLEVSLYAGIPALAKIGDSREAVKERGRFSPSRALSSIDESLTKIGITDAFFYSKIGTRVYFRADHVVLIELQEPFRGIVKTSNLPIFPFALPPGNSWEELLVKDFGPPTNRVQGGRLASDSLFYNWGDISYNRMGPNQIALYRDTDIRKYRETSFGRVIEMWQQ